jgi:hypothetical protein
MKSILETTCWAGDWLFLPLEGDGTSCSCKLLLILASSSNVLRRWLHRTLNIYKVDDDCCCEVSRENCCMKSAYIKHSAIHASDAIREGSGCTCSNLPAGS